MYGFPTKGEAALVLSTGDASVVADPASVRDIEKDQFGNEPGTELDGAGGADGNDLTQLKLTLSPPPAATCVSFDFMFLSEEFPHFTGQNFNDIFTAELNESVFSLAGDQVIAPNNFAYSDKRELLSVNTFSSFEAAPDSSLNGRSPHFSATSSLEPATLGGPVVLILSVQDLGDSALDSAVVVDNLRYFAAENCTEGITSIVDSDGDGLSDVVGDERHRLRRRRGAGARPEGDGR